MNKDRFKFRLWNKEAKQMFSSDIVYIMNGDYYIIHSNGEEEFLCPNPFGECHIMQCTGFKDKYGKLIYEGDIVCLDFFNEGKYYIRTVIYSEHSGGFLLKNEDKKVQFGDYTLDSMTIFQFTITIIRNIYE